MAGDVGEEEARGTQGVRKRFRSPLSVSPSSPTKQFNFKYHLITLALFSGLPERACRTESKGGTTVLRRGGVVVNIINGSRELCAATPNGTAEKWQRTRLDKPLHVHWCPLSWRKMMAWRHVLDMPEICCSHSTIRCGLLC